MPRIIALQIVAAMVFCSAGSAQDGDIIVSPDGASCPFTFSNNGSDPTMSSNNMYGILGTADDWLWEVRSYYMWVEWGLYETSDERVKTNVRDIGPVCDKLSRVRAVKYDHMVDQEDENDRSGKLREEGRGRVGLLAQNLLEEFPELVKQDPETGLYGVNYTKMVPILVQAIKEQQELIDLQNARIDELANGLKSK